eukprot:SAG22_NODE_8205_length_675_cov_0.711806_1_plen_105_part_01
MNISVLGLLDDIVSLSKAVPFHVVPHRTTSTGAGSSRVRFGCGTATKGSETMPFGCGTATKGSETMTGGRQRKTGLGHRLLPKLASCAAAWCLPVPICGRGGGGG